ncbi:recombinase family protein [Streptosporangium roseum]|uniref:recombinase family protein n=1 Tax=Streptosporangium roseum TaxID=2001 RepID=UPI003332BEF0
MAADPARLPQSRRSHPDLLREDLHPRHTAPRTRTGHHPGQGDAASGVAVTLVVHEHKRLGRGLALAELAEQLRACDVGLEFLTGELQGSHDPSGVVFIVLAALSGMEREYIRDRTLEGHESARKNGKAIGGATVTDPAMLSMALHLRDQDLSLREIASRLIITQGAERGRHPSPATVMRMLREHDESAAELNARADGASMIAPQGSPAWSVSTSTK